jgi:N-acetylglucosamine-6-sulfatase
VRRLIARPARLPAARLAAVIAVAGVAVVVPAGASAAPEPPPPPNIVVVMADDQELMTKDGQRVWLRRKIMPQTYRLFASAGTVFSDYVVTTPVCCPSRASFLTGQYGHNNGVLANKPGYAGLVEPQSTLPVWLRSAGYRTAHVGKWLHGYADAVGDAAIPAPGFQHWVELLNFDKYYGYDLSIDGTREHFGTANGDYVTTVLNGHALDWVEQYVEGERPLFLSVGQMAPHSAKALPNQCTRSALPARHDADLFQNEQLPLPPSYSEPDVSDKPSFIQERSLIDATQSADLRRRLRCRLAAMREVDRGTKQLVEAFADAGELGKTIFVFTSDNGYFNGEHRLRTGKGLPYEEAIRVPLAIRVPPKYLGDRERVPLVELPTANIDLAPTLLQLARAQPCDREGSCRALDGRSLVPLLKGKPGWPENRTVVIEQQNELEGVERRRDFGACTYFGLRSPSELYVEHRAFLDPATGSCVQQSPPFVEHYDLLADPFQTQNLLLPGAELSEHQAALAERLQVLRNCAGTELNPVPGREPCE